MTASIGSDVSPVSLFAATQAEVLNFLNSGLRAGRRGVLVTITNIVGSSARALGAQMAVLDDGSSAGSFSGGCVEAAIVAEALVVLGEGRTRSARFGIDSPYLDIRLPCGGGVDLLFTCNPDQIQIAQAVELLGQRRPFALALSAEGRIEHRDPQSQRGDGWIDGNFQVYFRPPLRLIIIGQGAACLFGVRLATSLGIAVELITPDAALVALMHGDDIAAMRIKTPTSLTEIAADRWSAILLLFHDHDWETAILEAALATPAFWIGAMGSPKTQAERLGRLSASGATNQALARIRGPIGLIPHARDPAMLALSALAEIADRYQRLLA